MNEDDKSAAELESTQGGQSSAPPGISDLAELAVKQGEKPKRLAKAKPAAAKIVDPNQDNKIIRLLEKNPLGMTLPEMAGGPRQVKKIKTLRPMLADAIRLGMVMPVSQRAGSTVYRLVKYLGPR